jgi:hypothetical protein
VDEKFVGKIIELFFIENYRLHIKERWDALGLGRFEARDILGIACFVFGMFWELDILRLGMF